ncbi:MAG: hypothetical protein QG656_2433, partial [Candidatus Hydrogenedentes bacterium]|nr:hypothetical protein [Candidatus Hydrogenedentota bacterium]
GAAPVLRYCHETTPVPAGIGPEFARGDYVHPLYGLDGEVLTEDYPADHPHHRAVNWSWATIQWRGETRDLFAVRGIYARPVSLRADTTGGKASIDAESVWKWDDKEEVVREKVLIETYLRDDKGRIVDFTIQLTPVVEGIEFCGRLEAGYSGFNVRMAPGEGQRISLYNDPVDALPCRSFGDYSAQFPGGKGRSGLAILQCSANPKYPSEWREYPQLNFFQPAFPGGALIPMPKGETITLKYRLWVHADGVDDVDLAAQWDAYNVKEAKP